MLAATTLTVRGHSCLFVVKSDNVEEVFNIHVGMVLFCSQRNVYLPFCFKCFHGTKLEMIESGIPSSH